MQALAINSRGSLGGAALARCGLPYGLRAAPSASRAIRAFVAVASSRLVLTPTGSGSWDHIGSKVPLPQPIPLADGVYEVGRAAPADILLPLPTVSARHALLRVEGDVVRVTDLNSTNGTVVNGDELTPMDDMQVGVGSEIIFGDMYLARFQLDLAAEPGTPSKALGDAPAASESARQAASGTLSLGLNDEAGGAQ